MLCYFVSGLDKQNKCYLLTSGNYFEITKLLGPDHYIMLSAERHCLWKADVPMRINDQF